MLDSSRYNLYGGSSRFFEPVPQRHFRCPHDFSKLEVPKDTPWQKQMSMLEAELVRCPKCGYKIQDWFIKHLKDEIERKQAGMPKMMTLSQCLDAAAKHISDKEK